MRTSRAFVVVCAGGVASGVVAPAALGQVETLTLQTLGSFGDPPLIPAEDEAVVVDFVGPIGEVITFNEVPENTILGDQFADLGVVFNDGNSRVEDDFFNPGEAIVDGPFNFPEGDPTIDISFALDQTAIALSYTGDIQIQLFEDGSAVTGVIDLGFASTDADQPLARNISGLTSVAAFDRVVLSRANNSGPFIDDLFVQNVVPGPGVFGLLAVAGVVSVRRRR